MTEKGLLCLADSNILLRLMKRDDPNYLLVSEAVRTLRQRGIRLAYTLQNMTEFWNVSTRPKAKNGFGLTVDETEMNAQDIELNLTFLPDNDAIYREWRRLVFLHRVSGVQVHDARLAAAMYANRITNILTFTGSDFARYPGIAAIHPISV